MKTEDFDDSIRKKIESLYSSHDQHDVDRIYDYLQSSKVKNSKRRYVIFGIIYSILFIVGGLITWNISQMKEHDKLQKTVEILKTDLRRSILENKQLNHNRDTVLITKDIGSENNNPQRATNNIEKKEVRNITSHKTLSNFASANFVPQTKASSQPAKLQLEEPTKNTPSREDKIYPSSGDVIHPNRETAANLPLENVIRSSASLPVSVSKPLTTPEEMTTDKKQSEILNATDSSFAEARSTPPIEILLDSSLARKSTDKPVIVPNWKYRVGIDFEGGNRQLGYGVVGEAVFKNTWNVSLGFKRLKNGDENFDDDDDFNKHKKKEFKKTYDGHVHDTSNEHIKIQNVIYQIPIMLSYNLPLKKNYSLLFGTGTDIEIYVKQHIGYNHVVSSSDIVTQSFVTHYSPVYFNNALLSAGIQKSIKKFVIQLSPYVSAQIKKVTYKSESVYYGLRLRILYAF